MFFLVGNIKNNKPLLLKAESNVTAKYKIPLDNPIDVLSVSYSRFNECSIRGGKLLGSLYCGSNHHQNTKPLDFAYKGGETYYLIGEYYYDYQLSKARLSLVARFER